MSDFRERLERGDEDLIAVPRWVLRELAAGIAQVHGLPDDVCPVCRAAAIAREASLVPAGYLLPKAAKR